MDDLANETIQLKDEKWYIHISIVTYKLNERTCTDT